MEGAGNDARYDQLKRLATPPAPAPKPAIAGTTKLTKEAWPVDEAAGSTERAGEGSARMAALRVENRRLKEAVAMKRAELAAKKAQQN